MLCLTRPDEIEAMHDAFLSVGVDAIETASFGSFATVLSEYGIPDQTFELNRAAASIARRVADDHETDGRPAVRRRVDRSGHQVADLGHISFAQLRDEYEEQARGLLAAASTCSWSRPASTCCR